MDNDKTAKSINYNVNISGNVNAPITIGDNNNITNNEQKLFTELLNQGITEAQVNDLITILKEEKQDTKNRTLGAKAKSWCDSIKTVGLNVLSNLIFTAYYGLPPFA